MTILKAILDAIIAVLRFIVEAILAILRAILWLLKKFSSTFSVKASAASLIFSLTARGCLQFSELAPLPVGAGLGEGSKRLKNRNFIS